MAAENNRRGVVFLDRDGTINVDFGYVTRPEKVVLLDGAAEAIGGLRRAGYLVVVVSNQSAVGQGMASIEDVESCNLALERLLKDADRDAGPDLILFAPDHPDTASEDRKPGIGLFKKAGERWGIDPRSAWVVGDKLSDIQFGLNAGLPAERCLLVRTGKGESELGTAPEAETASLRVFPSLLEASRHIVGVEVE